MTRHSLILYRDDHPGNDHLPSFEGNGWLAYIPIRLHETKYVQKSLPPNAVAVLINQAHSDLDIFLPVNANEKQIVDAINGERTIEEIIHHHSHLGTKGLSELLSQARGLFERLYNYDQVMFDTSPKSGEGSP
jgi:hypothetical protein